MPIDVRIGTVDDRRSVLNVLDGAALETDHDRIRDRLAAGDVIVAVPEHGTGRILGACVLDGDRITAIAVRRRRRDQGIGTALVRRAASERDRLVATVDADVLPFYERLGFDVRKLENGRYAGVIETDSDT